VVDDDDESSRRRRREERRALPRRSAGLGVEPRNIVTSDRVTSDRATLATASRHSRLWPSLEPRESISTNGANRPTQRPRVRNVWRCHWLSKRRANTKKITSQTWARLDVSGGGPLSWHASIPTDAPHRISMTARSSRNCLQATGHAFQWLSWSEHGTRGGPTTRCSGRGVPRLPGGAAPQLWTAHPRGGPKISRSGPARE